MHAPGTISNQSQLYLCYAQIQQVITPGSLTTDIPMIVTAKCFYAKYDLQITQHVEWINKWANLLSHEQFSNSCVRQSMSRVLGQSDNAPLNFVQQGLLLDYIFESRGWQKQTHLPSCQSLMSSCWGKGCPCKNQAELGFSGNGSTGSDHFRVCVIKCLANT